MTTRAWLAKLIGLAMIFGLGPVWAEDPPPPPPPTTFGVGMKIEDSEGVSRTVFCADEAVILTATEDCSATVEELQEIEYEWHPDGQTTKSITLTGLEGDEYNGNFSVDVTISNVETHTASAVFTVVEIEEIEFNDNPVPPGGTTQASATIKPAGRTIKWSKVPPPPPEEGENAAEEPDVTINADTGVITVGDDSVNGTVTIRAEDSELSECYTEMDFEVDCDCATGTCADSGECDPDLESVHVKFHLGRGEKGQRAGKLFIKAGKPTLTLATPQALRLSRSIGKVEPIMLPGSSNILRQVKAPETLADILPLTPFKYEIRFYKAADVGAKDTNGLYTVTAVPFVGYVVENPAATTNDIGTLRITQTRGSAVVIHEYVYTVSGGIGEWTLNAGNGLTHESLSTQTNALGKVTLRTMRDGAGNAVSQTRTTYRKFDWGNEIIEQVTDPDGAALTTTKTYYDDTLHPGQYGKLRQVNNSDGSWTRYDYDPDGRVTLTLSSWLDAASNAAPSAALAVYKSYMPVDPLDDGSAYSRLPRVVEEKVLGTTVSKTFAAHYYSTNNPGERVEIEEQAASATAVYGASGNQRTTRVYYPIASGEPDSGKLKSTLLPDGRMDSSTYEAGEYAGGVFTPGPTGTCIRATVTHGITGSPSGLANKTTRETTVSDQFGRTLLQEQYVYTGGGYDRFAWTQYTRDEFGHELSRVQSNGEQVDSTWACCGKDYEKDAQGIEQTFSYDYLKRLVSSAKEGIAAGTYPAQDAITTTYTLDAMGRQILTVVSAGSLSQVTSNAYDLAGRLVRRVDASGLVTEYARSANGLIETVTQPGGTTRITERYPDGKVKSVTGTAAPAQYYEYGIDAVGSQWTKVTTGTGGGPVWQKTTTDILGRTVKTEKPGFSGVETSESFYNSKGQLIRNTVPGVADTLFEYNELGDQVRSGFDLNGNGALDLASMDRITENETPYQSVDGAWWRVTTQRAYSKDNDATPATIGTSRQRLTGLGGSGATPIVSESISSDILGNQTVSRTTIDRAAKTVTQTTDTPDSSVDAQSISVNGLLVSARSKSGVTTTFISDALGRRTSAIDARIGASITYYDSNGRVDYVEDAAGHRTSRTYDEATGRTLSQTDPLTNTTYFSHTAQGQMEKTWGGAPYPVRYEFDQYQRMIKMATYRAGTNFNGPTWPASAGDGDVTTWAYDEASGLLTSKEDAAGKAVTYTYHPGGRLATRTWARTTGTNALVTTYSYDNAGNVTLIDYSDGTPDVTFTYDRMGRQTQAASSVSTHTFEYNATLQLISETIAVAALGEGGSGSTNILTRSYDVLGRSSGLALNDSYSTTYAFDPYGRFSSLAASVYSVSSVVNNAFSYSYLTNSDLLSGLASDSGLSVTRSYEPNRNLLLQIQNVFGTNTFSSYSYENDAGGRRISVKTSGSAFEAGDMFNEYGYNSRSEVTSADRFFGSNAGGAPTPGQSFAYSYDNIGNRQTAMRDNDAQLYTANALNQYTQRTVPGALHVEGVANTGATITVNSLLATRYGSYWHKYLEFDNTSTGGFAQITVNAALYHGATNGNDLIASGTGQIYIAKTPEQFTHDADGNLTQDGRFIYGWDGENRLTSVESATSADKIRLEFAYDYMSRRVSKNVYSWSASSNNWQLTTANFFVWDGWNVISELTTDNRQQSTNLYVWGLDLSGSLQGAGGIGGLLACYRSTTEFVSEDEDEDEDGHQHQNGQGHSEHGNGHGYGHEGDNSDDEDHDGHGHDGDDDDGHGGHGGHDGDGDDDEWTVTNRADVFLYTYDANGNVSELLSTDNGQQATVSAHYEGSIPNSWLI